MIGFANSRSFFSILAFNHCYIFPLHMIQSSNCFYFQLFSGTDSPKAVRKLMSLSEPGKTRRRHQPKHSVSSLHTNPSPPPSPKGPRKSGHERSVSETAPAVSLSAESSSVAALTTIRKGGASTTSTSIILVSPVVT